MQIGDSVQVLGTVRDIVHDNVLVATADGHEYWFISAHVSEQPAPAEAPPGRLAAAIGAPSTSTPPATAAPPDLESMTKDELVAYAQKALGLRLDVRHNKDDLIAQIEDAVSAKK